MFKKLFAPVRLLLGVILVVFGLNGFFHFITPPAMSIKGTLFIQALVATGYMLPFWKGTEVICGICFLFNRYVAFASVVVMPVILNIFAFHLFLDRGNLLIGMLMVAMNLIVMFTQREKLYPVLRRD